VDNWFHNADLTVYVPSSEFIWNIRGMFGGLPNKTWYIPFEINFKNRLNSKTIYIFIIILAHNSNKVAGYKHFQDILFNNQWMQLFLLIVGTYIDMRKLLLSTNQVHNHD